MASLPGLTESLQPIDIDNSFNEPHRLSVPQASEWRVQVPPESTLTIKVLSGIAEIFGTELANDVDYCFQGTKFALYAVEPIELEWKCPELSESISDETSMINVYNLHFALEKMRISSFDGPRVLIVGDSSTGKSSLAKTLCSYAIKYKQYQPLYVNLNPQDGIFSPPGCLSATPISDILDVESNSWGQSMTGGATKLHSKQPVVKNFGLERISDNRDLYMFIMQKLSEAVHKRLQNDPLIRRSGLIIDTPPISELHDTYTELQEIVTRFRVNAIVVCSKDDNLTIKINEAFQSQVGAIVSFPVSNGVFQVDDVFKRTLQRICIKEYFYGGLNTVLSPYTVGANFEDITIWQPKICTDADETTTSNNATLELVEITASNLQHALVAITYAGRKASKEEVLQSSILGYALVTEVNDSRRKLRILLPVPGRLPDKSIILTAYRYLE